jgi:hypothetical protein
MNSKIGLRTLIEVFAHCAASAILSPSKEDEVESLETTSSELIDEVDDNFPQVQPASSESGSEGTFRRI